MTQWFGNFQQQKITGNAGIIISCAHMIQAKPSNALIIVNGRIESYLKYQDLANEFYRQGLSVYMYDHRGQGLSGRQLSNSQKGHVDSFDDYVDDLELFIDKVVLKHNNLFMMGHSMGGAIACQFLLTKQHVINKLVLSSPMHGIILPAPKLVIKWLTKLFIAIDNLLHREPSFVIGGHAYINVPFSDNELTQCKTRYDNFRQLYQEVPQIELGSVTNQWLQQALIATDTILKNAEQFEVATLLLQAGDESIVDNKAQDRFAKSLPPSLIDKIFVSGARHEILFERDEYRQPALDAIFEFFDVPTSTPRKQP